VVKVTGERCCVDFRPSPDVASLEPSARLCLSPEKELPKARSSSISEFAPKLCSRSVERLRPGCRTRVSGKRDWTGVANRNEETLEVAAAAGAGVICSTVLFFFVLFNRGLEARIEPLLTTGVEKKKSQTSTQNRRRGGGKANPGASVETPLDQLHIP